MARILFLTQILPYPLNAGARVRAYHMLRHLSGRHDVTLVSFTRADDTAEAVEHLRGICRAVYTVPMRRALWRNVRAGVVGLAKGQPIVIVRDDIAEMQGLIRRLAAQRAFDVVHADQLSMSAYGLQAAREGGSRSLLDEHNAVFLLTDRMAADERGWLRRVIMKREARAFAHYERLTCQAYDAVLTVTSEDREQLLSLYSPTQRVAMAEKFTVVPISVDPDAVRPVPRRAEGPPTILHVGTMFWPPNVTGVMWFANEVLPLILQRRPDARFVIVGKTPPPEVQALAAHPNISVTGYVADLAPYLADADAFVVPLHAGGGMRVKILDAWLWGLPVVSTPIGAEGIELQHGENILLASDASSFAESVVRLLDNGRLNQHLRTAGRAWVEATYSWRAVYERVDQVYTRLLATTPISRE